MPSALTPLANITLGSSAASVTFSSIAATYKDLYLVAQTGLSSAGQTVNVQFNNDTASNYNTVIAYGDGSSRGSAPVSNATSIFAAYYGQTANTPKAQLTLNFLDYSVTDKHKSLLIRNNDAGYVVEMMAARWASTSAITTIKLYPGAGNFVTGSTFALYGVSA